MKIFVSLCIALTLSLSALAQEKRIDHLTVAEDDLIHDIQEIDKRMEFFVKAVDRRFLALSGGTLDPKTAKKDEKTWGALPAGTPAELLSDIKSILNEAVVKLEDAAERDSKNALLPKSLKILSDGCTRFVPQLKTFYDNAKTDAERAAAFDATRTCEEVIEVQSKN